ISRVGFAENFSSSLAPCTRTMVARSRQKIFAASLHIFLNLVLNHYTMRKNNRSRNYSGPACGAT
ncbi:MAG TPA: hypothetical protein VGJ00_08855, partial [Rhabdochlamydiaceae bacterium]